MSGLFQAPRALTVQSAAIAQIAGQPALVPLKLEGVEGINRLFEYRLTLQTPDALNFTGGQGSNFALDDFIGKEITCFIELGGHGIGNQGAGVRELSAVITDARFIGQDNRHALYELTLRPWLHLATLTTDCKVFQDQAPIQVIEAVLADYPFAADKRLIETYPVRDYCVQYNETDFEFVTRLMQEWGINYHWEHSGGVHRLIWSDHNGAFQVTQQGKAPSAYHQIPFYPLGHKIDREYIHGFSPKSRVTSGSFESRDYDYTRPKATLSVNDAAPRNTGHADGDVYLWRGDRHNLAGSDYSQPNKGTDKAANQTETQGKHLARLRMQALRQSGNRASGVGHVRGIVPGCTFTLTEHPQEKANAEYLVLDTKFLIENNPPSPPPSTTLHPAGVRGALNSPFGGFASATLSMSDVSGGIGSGLASLVALSDAERLAGHWRVHVAFDVQPTTEALRPQSTQRKPKTGGPETALVVGPNAETAESNIYTDSLGRIKVQFPWDRYGQKNQNSSCWVRVSSSWAGNQLGAMHVPRIGQEVIVDFLGGDPDLPIATGRVYNQLNTPPWSLPEQQALSGFRSRELNPDAGNSAGGRSNHLILDDTKEKIQAQLKSDHQHSQLSLGHITRIEDNQGRKDYRGEGLELRTDGHGAIRAKDGLLISTEARTGASGYVKDLSETANRLAQAQDQHASLGELALQHEAQEDTDQGDVAKDLKQQHDEIKGRADSGQSQSNAFPELQQPHLVLASPAGVATTTKGSTHHHSERHHAITSGAHTSISTARSFLVSAAKAIRLFAYKGGVKLVAAAVGVEVQALEKSIHFLSKVSITEKADTITFTARKEITINGGTSFSVFNASGITHGTPGSVDVKAASKAYDGPKSMGVNVHGLPHADLYDEKFEWLSPTGAPLLNRPYTLQSGQNGHAGLTQADGRTPQIYSTKETELTIKRQWAEFQVPPRQTFVTAEPPQQTKVKG